MGNKCNSKYKLAKDIMYKDDGTRRKAIYLPYNLGGINIRISLDQSEPFAGKQDLFPLPRWELEFEPKVEEVSTWETVFHISERYQRDILDAEFKKLVT